LSGLRPVAEPFVAAVPNGVRVRTRLRVSEADGAVLGAVGSHLGSLAGRDLARRCGQGRLSACAAAESRRERKQALTGECTSRWAGAITRTSADAWEAAERNMAAEARSLRARIGRIRRRLALPAGERRGGRTRGYASQEEHWAKQQRLQRLQVRLADVDCRLAEGRVSIVRGGRRLAKARHSLAAAGLDETGWRQRWRAKRWFITADGEAGKNWGNETIRWHPGQGWLEIRLPAPLAQLANRPHGRYRLSAPVSFPYRGEEAATQAASGAVRYDISYDPGKDRWYLDASWTFPAADVATLDELRQSPMLAVDLNDGHLAAWVLDTSGNPLGEPITVGLDMDRLSATARDGHLRTAVSVLIGTAAANGCRAIVIEDLDFEAARAEGRERSGHRPSRGRRGRAWRRMVAGIPTARFRDRLVQMTANAGLAVIVVDPAYTSRWGAQHWLAALKEISPVTSGHHAAAVVIGRRGLGQRARRRERRDQTRPEDRERRAANSAAQTTPAPPAGLPGPRIRKPGDRKARGQPHPRQKTRPAERASPRHQGSEDRSLCPEVAMSYSLPRRGMVRG
jgi:hypothetical protein